MARRIVVSSRRSLAVVGAGWAGLAAAVHACEGGRRVTVFDMAPYPGGRARTVALPGGGVVDNGQHILLGAYRETLALMSRIGVDVDSLLMRRPLELRYPDGRGLKVTAGPPLVGFALGVLTARGWTFAARWSFLRTAWRWRRHGMRNPGVATVSELCAGLPEPVRTGLIEPLCVAAMNTPADEACATVFLRILADALFATPGGSDLLLPRAGLSDLLPQRAMQWLGQRGATVMLGRRVNEVKATSDRWLVDGEWFDDVVLACTSAEAARLVRLIAPGWSAQADTLRHEPIATVYLRRPGPALKLPMLALHADGDNPAQFVFDLEVLGPCPAALAFVVSGAAPWLVDGLDALVQRVRGQALRELPAQFSGELPAVLHAAAERRATFACTPGLQRPTMAVVPGLVAAGDYIEGPYPATLEGAIRSGLRAARSVLQNGRRPV